MKKLLVLAGLLAMATPAWTAVLACSATTAYTDYVVNGFSCTVGGLVFSDFSLGAGSFLAAGDVTVAEVADGLRFSYDLSTTSNQVTERSLNIGFQVDLAIYGIAKATLAFQGTGTDPGVTAMVVENFAGGPLEVFQKTPTLTTETRTTQSVDLGPSATLVITESATVKTIATGAARTASIASMTDTFYTPEPGSFVLFGVSLVGLVMVRMKRARS